MITTCCGNACFGRQAGSKYGPPYSEPVTGLCALARLFGWRYISSLHSADMTSNNSNKDEIAAHCCDPALSVLVMFGVSAVSALHFNLLNFEVGNGSLSAYLSSCYTSLVNSCI